MQTRPNASAKSQMNHQIMPKHKHQIVPNPKPWGSIRSSLHFLIAALVATLLIVTVYLTQEYGVQFLEDCTASTTIVKTSGDPSSSCNLFSGKWVFDNQSYPLYKGLQCTYMSDQLACEKFGRKDLSFQNRRWQPHECDLPRSLPIPLSISCLGPCIFSRYYICFAHLSILHYCAFILAISLVCLISFAILASSFPYLFFFFLIFKSLLISINKIRAARKLAS